MDVFNISQEGKEIITMTNQQAADILKEVLKPQRIFGGRGNGKTMLLHARIVALLKAIELLEATPETSLVAESLNKEILPEELKCTHKNKDGSSAIRYCNSYEMRTSDMMCGKCGLEGTREELEG